jgi:hypothetical protein
VSQNPLPYQPPDPYGQGYYHHQYHQDPYQAALKPARRAGIMLFIVGGLSLICGGCLGVTAAMLTMPELADQIQGQHEALTLPPPAPMAAFGLLWFFCAIVLLALGIPVMRASRRAIEAAIAVCILLMLTLVLSRIGMAAIQDQLPPALLVSGIICELIAFLAPFVLLLVWLSQALKISPVAEQWAIYQQQYQQYLQSQAYAQGPYGQQAGAPAPPPGQPPVQPYSPPPPPPPDGPDHPR